MFLFLAIVLCINFLYSLSSRIALSSQGSAEYMQKWITMHSNMRSRQHVVLFVLTYDIALDPIICSNHTNLRCIFKPKTTWTSGRNTLAREIYRYESENSLVFRYWAFADDDIVAADCHAATGCEGKASDCCFDSIAFLLTSSSVEYASVNFVILGGVAGTGGPMKAAHLDCNDAAMNAYHRSAVPLVMPYIELVDRFSWWGAQYLEWVLISSCISGSSIFVGVFDIKATPNHSKYPRGRYYEVEHDAAVAVFGRRGLIPNPVDISWQREQKDCTKLNYPIQNVFVDSWKSGDWFHSEKFKTCLAAMKPRFYQYMATGNISATDYIDFGDYKTVP